MPSSRLAHRLAIFYATAALLAVTCAKSARADGGYFSGAQGAHAAGRGGAFVARADDLSAATINPAGFARVGGTQLELDNNTSYNQYRYTRRPTLDWGHANNGAAPTVSFPEVKNGAPWQPLDPMLGVVSNLGLRDWGFALVAGAPPAISRQEYPLDGGQRYMMVKREAIVLDYSASAAWKYQEQFGLGVSLHWIDVPRLEYQLVLDANTFPARANPVSSDLDMLATIKGSDRFIPNAVLGAWYRPIPALELALSGQVIPAEIKTHSTLSVQALNTGVVDSVVLRRGSKSASDVTLTLPLPMTARFGVRYRKVVRDQELWDLEFDTVYETWARVQSFVLDSNGIAAHLLGQTVNIGRIEVQKHWRDTVAFHLGGDYRVLPGRLTLRAGASYQSATAQSSYANIDFAAGAALGGALGASVFFGKIELAAGYQYLAQLPVTTDERAARVYQTTPGSTCAAPYTSSTTCNAHYLGQPGPAANAGSYHAYSQIASVGAVYRF